MKKTAVLIYDSFCNFELSVALEILAFAKMLDIEISPATFGIKVVINSCV